MIEAAYTMWPLIERCCRSVLNREKSYDLTWGTVLEFRRQEMISGASGLILASGLKRLELIARSSKASAPQRPHRLEVEELRLEESGIAGLQGLQQPAGSKLRTVTAGGAGADPSGARSAEAFLMAARIGTCRKLCARDGAGHRSRPVK